MNDVPCPSCGLVYDLTVYKPGQRCRCQCGQVLVVPEQEGQIKVARTLHCSNCGGTLEKGNPQCSFCGAMVDLTDARMTAYCGSCLSMNKEGARFCSECGKDMVSRVEAPEEADESCPRCNISMRRRTVGSKRPLECPACCGLFVDATDLESMIAQQEQRIDAGAGGPGGTPHKAVLPTDQVAYLKCPVCSTMMNRMNYGRLSGVLIDYCRSHGYWLDAGELEKIARWVASGGLLQKRQREIDDLKAQKDRSASSPMLTGAMYSPENEFGDGFGRSSTAGVMMGGGLLGMLSKLFD